MAARGPDRGRRHHSSAEACAAACRPAIIGTTPTEGAAMAEVVALRRPPVRQSVLVRSARPHTFETFVGTMGTWWPVNPFSAGKDRVRDVTVERRIGGAGHATRAGGPHGGPGAGRAP